MIIYHSLHIVKRDFIVFVIFFIDFFDLSIYNRIKEVINMKDRIKALRTSLGLTQSRFAESVGVKQNTVAQYEIGRNPPTDTVITLICNKYNVNEQWLRNGEGEMFNPLVPHEEIAKLIKAVDNTDESNEGECFRRALISALARIPPDKWGEIAKFVDTLIDDFKQ